MRAFLFLTICFITVSVQGQEPVPTSTPPVKPAGANQTLKKANVRPADAPTVQADPFDGAPVEKMREQCVTLETEAGSIEIELMPEVAPESVRNFLNLAATGSLDTTTFSRVVKDFVIQGGNLATSAKCFTQAAGRTQYRETRARDCLDGSRRGTKQCQYSLLYSRRRRPASQWKVCSVWQSAERNGGGRCH